MDASSSSSFSGSPDQSDDAKDTTFTSMQSGSSRPPAGPADTQPQGERGIDVDVDMENEGPPKKSSLVTRTVTGCVVGFIATLAIARGDWTYAYFVSLIIWLVTLEYIGLIKSKRLPKGLKPPPALLRRSMTFLCVGMVIAAQFGFRTGVFETASFLLLSMLLVKKSTKKKLKKKKVRFSELTMLVFGLFYCGYLPTFWVRLRGVSLVPAVPPPAFLERALDMLGGTWTVGLIVTVTSALAVVAADTGAYIGGKLLGATPLISISPNKTVEGAVCGFAASLSVPLVVNALVGWPGNHIFAVALAVVVYISSVFGDLIESSMKRAAGKKDSGSILPGHGGLLDRFDSYIFTGAFAYCLVYWYFWNLGTPLSQLVITPPR